jgi:REP element-mobilizing transposase RayT
MANNYTQLYVHYIFAVQNRLSLIRENFKNDLYRYMNGIIVHQGHKLYIINGMSDHIHVLVSMNPRQAPTDLMYHIKRRSSLWINEKSLFLVVSHGRRVLEHFHLVYPSYQERSNTLKNNTSLIRKLPSEKNTWNFLKRMKLYLMNVTSLCLSNNTSSFSLFIPYGKSFSGIVRFY